MAVTFVAAGAVTNNSTAISPPLPAGLATGDILLLYLETQAQAITITNSAGGTWAETADSPQENSGLNVRLTCFWSRYNGTQTAPTTSDSGDHQTGVILAYRGCVATGDPWDVTAGDSQDATTAGSIPGDTTTVAGCMIVAAAATDRDAATTTNASGWTNASLVSITERVDQCFSGGAGGGLAIADGIKTTAGAFNATTWTQAASAALANITIALESDAATITGTVAAAQADDVGALAGTVLNPITGTIAATQADQTGAFVGVESFTGTISATQDPNIGAFSGLVANPVTGTIGAIQADQVAAFTGQSVTDGTWNSIQADQVGVFNGTVANPVTGVLGATQADQTGSFTGTSLSPGVTGTIAAVQDPNVMAAAGDVIGGPVTGTLNPTQANQTAAFVGAVANPVAGSVTSVTCVLGGPTATCTISPVTIIAGSNAVVTATFRDANGDLADPSSVTATVQAPDGTVSNPVPASSSVGIWTTTIPTDQAGYWFYQITGTGNMIDVVCTGSFCAQPSLVLV